MVPTLLILLTLALAFGVVRQFRGHSGPSLARSGSGDDAGLAQQGTSARDAPVLRNVATFAAPAFMERDLELGASEPADAGLTLAQLLCAALADRATPGDERWVPQVPEVNPGPSQGVGFEVTHDDIRLEVDVAEGGDDGWLLFVRVPGPMPGVPVDERPVRALLWQLHAALAATPEVSRLRWSDEASLSRIPHAGDWRSTPLRHTGDPVAWAAPRRVKRSPLRTVARVIVGRPPPPGATTVAGAVADLRPPGWGPPATIRLFVDGVALDFGQGDELVRVSVRRAGADWSIVIHGLDDERRRLPDTACVRDLARSIHQVVRALPEVDKILWRDATDDDAPWSETP